MAADARRRGPSRQLLTLGGLLAVLVVVVFYAWHGAAGSRAPSSYPEEPGAAAPPGAARGTAGAQDAPGPPALDVRLEALESARPDPAEANRNPFRFRPKPPPPPPPAPPKPPPIVSAPGGGSAMPPSGPPLPAPIDLKFIGVLEVPNPARPGELVKYAALRDKDCRLTFRGREGDIIEGRYRIVRIGEQSITMQYRDGRGTQTIPMNGQACVGR
jgi:hypothetical protein